MNIIQFRAREIRRENAAVHKEIERSIDVTPSHEDERRLWNAYMTAIRKSVDAQAEVNRAHNAWMNYAEKVTR